jgi:ABC-2 type transport system permease protein
MNWEQFKALIELRWRLTLNQLRRGGKFNFFAGIVGLVLGYLLVVGASIVGFIGGWKILGTLSSDQVLLFWDVCTAVFGFLWILGLLHEIQRSEMIDLQKLLHLPVALPQLFTLNYASSLTQPSVLIAGPALICVSLGWSLGHGALFLLLIPLVLGFVFMLTAWAYLIRGWLVSLMVNQRRRRTILALLTLGVVLLGQGPNLYFNAFGRHRPREGRGHPMADITTYAKAPLTRTLHTLLPPLWLAQGGTALQSGRPEITLLAALGCWSVGWLGMRIAFRSTMRFYLGTGSSSARRKKPEADPGQTSSGHPTASMSPAPVSSSMLEWELPGIPSQVAAIGLTSFRSMLRAPEMKMALLGPLLAMVVFAAVFMTRSRAALPMEARAFVASTLVSFIGFAYLQLLLNQFGFDRNGFRTLVLLPTERKFMLAGKNLSFLPFFFVPGLLGLTGLSLFGGVSLLVSFAGLLQLVALYALLCLVGNAFSIGVPLRIASGSLKPSKSPPKTVLLLMATHLVFPLFCLPVFVPVVSDFFLHKAGVTPSGIVNLGLSFVAAGVCIGVYFLLLTPMGEWLQKREREMLVTLTSEVE